MAKLSKALKEAVWQKGRPIPGVNPENFRVDAYGNVIRKASYGTQGKYGWEADHRIPKAMGGPHHITNLQPLHTVANKKKGPRIG